MDNSLGSDTVGLVLAAGAGRRMGRPKALIEGWLPRAIEALCDCATTTVVLGADADRVRELLNERSEGELCGALQRGPRKVSAERSERELCGTLTPYAVDVVIADRWAEGMGASLAAGLANLGATSPASISRCLVMLVDLPDVDRAVVRRVLGDSPAGAEVLTRAAYGDEVGHPVLLGRSHWDGVIASSSGDRGARDYLSQREVSLIACGDLATGSDQDWPTTPRES